MEPSGTVSGAIGERVVHAVVAGEFSEEPGAPVSRVVSPARDETRTTRTNLWVHGLSHGCLKKSPQWTFCWSLARQDCALMPSVSNVSKG